MFSLTSFGWNDLLKTTDSVAKARHAMTRRQNTIENESKLCRNLMKIAAVPKRTPAATPSIKELFLVLTCIQIPYE
jgi:hypothetical protein